FREARMGHDPQPIGRRYRTRRRGENLHRVARGAAGGEPVDDREDLERTGDVENLDAGKGEDRDPAGPGFPDEPDGCGTGLGSRHAASMRAAGPDRNDNAMTIPATRRRGRDRPLRSLRLEALLRLLHGLPAALPGGGRRVTALLALVFRHE